MQALHNDVIVNAGNASASLDPKQIPNDATDQLLKGAAALAAGKTLGLSEEEVLAAVSRQARAERRAMIGPQRATEQETISDILRQANQARAALGNTVSPIPGVAFNDDFGLSAEERAYEAAASVGSGELTEAATFNPTTEQTLRQGDRAFEGPEQQLRRELREGKQEKNLQNAIEEEKAARREAGKRVFKNTALPLSEFGVEQEQEFGRPGDRVELRSNRLEGGVFNSDTGEYSNYRQRNPRTGRVRPTKRELEEIRVGRGGTGAPGGEIRAEMAKRSQPDVESLGAIELERLARSDDRAAENAQAMFFPGTENYGPVEFQRGEALADADMPKARITGISPVNFYGSTGAGPSVQTAAMPPSSAAVEKAGVYYDPRSGLPVETFEPAVAIAGSNTPTSAQMLNAPPIQSASEFVAKLSTEGTINTGNTAYPQVPVGATLEDLDSRITRLSEGRRFSGLRSQVPAQVDSIDALQKTADAIIAMSGGKKLGRLIGSERVTTDNPGIMEALDALGIRSEYQMEQIALALKAREAGGQTFGFGEDNDRLQPDSLPLKKNVALEVIGKNADLRRSLGRARAEGRVTPEGEPYDEMTFQYQEGRPKGEAARQVTRTVGPVEDVAAIKRLQYLDDKVKRQTRRNPVTDEELSLLQNAVTFLREKRGVAQPTFGQAMDFIEEVYSGQVESGRAKPIDEASLAETIARTERVASRADEDIAMARLLRGPLRPGPRR